MRTILQNSTNVNCVRFNLTFIRHAETHANAEGIIQGLLDTELSHIGYLQSQALGQYLQYHRFSHIYSSDLIRAAETASKIRSFNRVSTCEIKYDSSLRERMYGVAEGQTRQWLRELAKECGVPYVNFTPPNAESIAELRERVIGFFQKLCRELLQQTQTNSFESSHVEFYEPSSVPQEDNEQALLRSISSENLISYETKITKSIRKRSLSTGSIDIKSIAKTSKPISRKSSVDSAFDLSSISSGQQSISSSMSFLSRNSSFEKHRNLSKGLSHSPYNNNFSELDVLVVSHGAVIREFIKYFACDLQTDIGKHLDTIQEIAPNTSVTRFQVIYSIDKAPNPTTTLELIDYHNKTHLINVNNDEYNLDVINKCSL